MEFRSEPMSDVPEVEEYIMSDSWQLTCMDLDCPWTSFGERTEDWMNEMHETIERHKQWHENGMPD
jgi:hypothetical protein